MYTISAFYKFIKIENCTELKNQFKGSGERLKLSGTILIASEGINGTIAGLNKDIESFSQIIREDPKFIDLKLKNSFYEKIPFQKWKVKVKKEILTFDEPKADPTARVGYYIKPKEWNSLINEPDILVIDTRNSYEIAIGTFPNAIDPQTSNFTDFKQFVGSKLKNTYNKKIAMFCTGGIRCEKASAYLLSQGFREVYHLEGGILKYLEEVNTEDSLWNGACFVFDERVSVGHGLKPAGHKLCFCGFPVPIHDPICKVCKKTAGLHSVKSLPKKEDISEISLFKT